MKRKFSQAGQHPSPCTVRCTDRRDTCRSPGPTLIRFRHLPPTRSDRPASDRCPSLQPPSAPRGALTPVPDDGRGERQRASPLTWPRVESGRAAPGEGLGEPE